MTTTAAAYATNLKQFKAECVQAVAHYKNYGRTKQTTELGTIATALGTDTTKHSAEVETPPQALRIGLNKSAFTNRTLQAVNKGKAMNLTNADMATALNTALAPLVKPVNIDVPHISGTGTVGSTLSCTMGNWSGTPTSYAYQWMRTAVAISGATSATYVLVAADSPAKSITAVVTATNSAGSTAAPPSNTIICA